MQGSQAGASWGHTGVWPANRHAEACQDASTPAGAQLVVHTTCHIHLRHPHALAHPSARVQHECSTGCALVRTAASPRCTIPSSKAPLSTDTCMPASQGTHPERHLGPLLPELQQQHGPAAQPQKAHVAGQPAAGAAVQHHLKALCALGITRCCRRRVWRHVVRVLARVRLRCCADLLQRGLRWQAGWWCCQCRAVLA